MNLSRRSLLKLGGLGIAAGLTGGCDSVGSVFGRMFAVPPRETLYFTPNDKFYVVLSFTGREPILERRALGTAFLPDPQTRQRKRH